MCNHIYAERDMSDGVMWPGPAHPAQGAIPDPTRGRARGRWAGCERTNCPMTRESRRVAGILLVVYPTVIFGGASLLSMLINTGSGYIENPLRQDLWRAG